MKSTYLKIEARSAMTELIEKLILSAVSDGVKVSIDDQARRLLGLLGDSDEYAMANDLMRSAYEMACKLYLYDARVTEQNYQPIELPSRPPEDWSVESFLTVPQFELVNSLRLKLSQLRDRNDQPSWTVAQLRDWFATAALYPGKTEVSQLRNYRRYSTNNRFTFRVNHKLSPCMFKASWNPRGSDALDMLDVNAKVAVKNSRYWLAGFHFEPYPELTVHSALTNAKSLDQPIAEMIVNPTFNQIWLDVARYLSELKLPKG